MFLYNMKKVRLRSYAGPQSCERYPKDASGFFSGSLANDIIKAWDNLEAHVMQSELSSHLIPLLHLTFKAHLLDSLNRINDAGWKL